MIGFLSVSTRSKNQRTPQGFENMTRMVAFPLVSKKSRSQRKLLGFVNRGLGAFGIEEEG